MYVQHSTYTVDTTDVGRVLQQREDALVRAIFPLGLHIYNVENELCWE